MHTQLTRFKNQQLDPKQVPYFQNEQVLSKPPSGSGGTEVYWRHDIALLTPEMHQFHCVKLLGRSHRLCDGTYRIRNVPKPAVVRNLENMQPYLQSPTWPALASLGRKIPPARPWHSREEVDLYLGRHWKVCFCWNRELPAESPNTLGFECDGRNC